MEKNNFPPNVIEELAAVGSLATGSMREVVSARLAVLREKYQRKPHDTGSPEVQVAMLTERLKGYERHVLEHRSDVNNRRNFDIIWQRRRKLLKYLRRTKYETYAFMMKELGLNEADIDQVGLSRTSGTAAARIKRD
jgi:small subunit ribosomal protein S15